LAAWRRQHAGAAVFRQGYGGRGEVDADAAAHQMESGGDSMGFPREWVKPVPGTEAYATYEARILGPLLDLAAGAGVL